MPSAHWLIPLAGLLAAASSGDGPKPAEDALAMTKAVVCSRITGYENFVELPGASLTGEDKLNVYFRPLNFRVAPVEPPSPGRRYKAKFREDARIRRKGEKAILLKKDKLVEYDAFFESPAERLYLLNNISLKGLTPGDYELDVVLLDLLDEGVSATQVVAFTIIPTPKVEPEAKPATPAEPLPPPPLPPSKSSKKTKVARSKP